MLYEYMENRANIDQDAEGLWRKARREKCESGQSLSALRGSASKQVHLTSLNNPHWSWLYPGICGQAVTLASSTAANLVCHNLRTFATWQYPRHDDW